MLSVCRLLPLELHSSASMLQYPYVILADGLRPGVFSYGRFVREAFNESVLMLLRRVSSRCLVSPMYTFPQVHGTS